MRYAIIMHPRVRPARVLTFLAAASAILTCGLISATTAAQASVDVLHAFTDASTDGAHSFVGMIQTVDGTLVGTTYDGGSGSAGTVFRMPLDGSGYAVLHSFGGPGDGRSPVGLIQAADGDLYGTTLSGGAGKSSGGTIFRMAPDGSDYAILHDFSVNLDGYPQAGLIQVLDGTLVGSTTTGGNGNVGKVFEIATDGSGYRSLHDFTYYDGAHPYAALTQAADGTLFGTTLDGGPGNSGTIFRIAADGSFNVLHSFINADGINPRHGIILSADGLLYGTTSRGGTGDTGTIFRMAPDGSGYGVLHNFDDTGDDSAFRDPTLVRAESGTFYGTTFSGGTDNVGTIFRMAPDGNSYVVLHSFNAAIDGTFPTAGLLQATDGNLFGTTTSGGAGNAGTVFRLILPVVGPRSPRDLDGDGHADLIWRQTETGDLTTWLMNGVSVKQTLTIASKVPMMWLVVQIGDLDGDGKTDLVWRQMQTGDVAIWLMNGATVTQTSLVAAAVPLAWQIVGLGDLDGDGKADLVWRHTTTGDVAAWLMNGVAVKQEPIVAPAVPLAWQIVGVGDLDGDAKADLVWRQTQTGDVAVWLMNGVAVKQAPIVAPAVPLAWQIVGVSDFNGDGKADLVWRQTQTGDLALWLMDGVTVKQAPVVAPGVPLAWKIVEIGDLDGDGNADIVWRDEQNGDVAVWLMRGGMAKQSPVASPTVPLVWQIQ